jgi:hypothetical protein
LISCRRDSGAQVDARVETFVEKDGKVVGNAIEDRRRREFESAERSAFGKWAHGTHPFSNALSTLFESNSAAQVVDIRISIEGGECLKTAVVEIVDIDLSGCAFGLKILPACFTWVQIKVATHLSIVFTDNEFQRHVNEYAMYSMRYSQH